MSRILKALATIESKGATLTLPREDAPQRPRRREDGPRAELSLASLEAYLQAALSADSSAALGGAAIDAMALCCAPGLAGPWIEPVAELQQLFDATCESGDDWAMRDNGPRALSTIVDRELPCEPFSESNSFDPIDLETFDSQDWLLTPAEDVVASVEVELPAWRDVVLGSLPAAATPIDLESIPQVLIEVDDDEVIACDVASFRHEAHEDLAAWTDCAEAFPAAAETVATATPSLLPGWPDNLPAAPPEEDLAEVSLEPLRLDAAPQRHDWLTEYELRPAEPDSQLAVDCPDWATVEAAQAVVTLQPPHDEAMLLAVVDELPASVIEPPPVQRRTLSSRELLTVEDTWNECRAIADSLLGTWKSGPTAWLFVELGACAQRTPIVAPLAAMLAESISGRVLLVDTDCRAAFDWQALGDIPPFGFADVMRHAAAWPKFVHHSSVPRLDLIEAGQRDPSGVRAAGEFAADAWLSAMRCTYDLVLLHSSWPGPATIAQLAVAAAATYLVTPLGADETEAHTAIEQLRTWGARVDGCIVTD